MVILGVLGSPRVRGNCGKLMQSALNGVASRGAQTKRFDLIKQNIEHCRGCFKCVFEHHELPVGKCPLKDDMASILAEYIKADGYIFATPAYDMSITSLMKKFLERKIALTCRSKEAYAKISEARTPMNFKKMASMIVTANCPDEFEELMGEPCFDAMNSHLKIEQVYTVDRFYVGGIENISDEVFTRKLEEAFQMGIRLVENIKKEQSNSSD